MAQLNTTYDSSIHQKIFVLKGDEGYARTTDTIATLIDTFGDYDSHIEYCHVGLEIQVLRELGKSTLYIYCDGTEIYAIPWSDSGMAQIIDENWNKQGVYWIDGKLVIGRYDETDYSDNDERTIDSTGLYLPYDVDHTITVRYDGNNNCLGSNSKPIKFNVPKPDKFNSELIFNKENPRYAPNSTINDITLTLTCDNELTSAKSVKIYDDSQNPPVLINTVSLEQDVPTTISLGQLSDGLHSIRALWQGDGESYLSEKTINVSVGYKITNLSYSSILPTGQTGVLSCVINDYFNEPYSGLEHITVVESISEGEWNTISQESTTDNNGFLLFGSVEFSSREFAISDGNWYSEKHSVSIVNPTDVTIGLLNPVSEYQQSTMSNTVSGMVYDNGSPVTVEGIDVLIYSNNSILGNASTDSKGRYSTTILKRVTEKGIIPITATIIGTNISETTSWTIPEFWWSTSQNKDVGNLGSTYGVNVSKKSNEYTFNPKSGYGYVIFPYESSGVYITYFDIINPEPTATIYFNRLSLPVGQFAPSRANVMIIHNTETGSVYLYVKGVLVNQGTYTGYNHLRMELDGGVIGMNNIIIAKELVEE